MEDVELAIQWAEETGRAYRGDWEQFVEWCEAAGVGVCPCDAADLAAWAKEMHQEGRAASTIRRRVVAVGRVHVKNGYTNPSQDDRVREMLQAVHYEQQYQPVQKDRLGQRKIARMVRALDYDSAALRARNRCVLEIAWATGFRRGELAALTMGDIRRRGDGWFVRLRKSMNRYQQKEPESRVLEPAREGDVLDPCEALEDWLVASGVEGGALFRRMDQWGNIYPEGVSGRTITKIIKEAASLAGLSSERVSSQSLRPRPEKSSEWGPLKDEELGG